MHKTIYIDTEEEIIGIINKIRKEEIQDIFLVVPKNSLLTQGIVNLKLLKKEVDKMGKKIILVTSDQHSRKIIKSVGLEMRNKSAQDFIKAEAEKENSEEKLEEEDIDTDEEKIVSIKKNKREIGTSDFYGDKSVDSEKSLEFENNKSLGIDKPQTVQNNFETKSKKKLLVKSGNSFGKEFIENRENRENFSKNISNNSIQKEIPTQNQNTIQDKHNQIENKTPKKAPNLSIDDFYQEKISQPSFKIEPKKHKNDLSPRFSRKFKLTLILILILFISLVFGGYWAFINWPKMKVQLFLNEQTASTNLDVSVCGENSVSNPKDCLKGEYKELTIEINEKYDSSGEKFSNDKGMARGTVKIYNNYSSESQPLVATTRILSKDGKLFRLVKNIVVPGKEGDTPGVVEAQIISDKIGQNFNIEPTEFTIEGFKGNEKYEKFKVFSEEATAGGANDTENKKVKTVTESDINLAREKSIEKFNNELKDNIKKQLKENEIFAPDSIEKEIIYSDSSYAIGDIIDKFNYRVEEKIKVIVFDKTEFQNLIKQSFSEESNPEIVFDQITELEYQKDVADYNTKKLNLNIAAKARYWPILNLEEIKTNLGDKNTSEVKNYLSGLKQINRAILLYSPSWLSSFPVKKRNITIEEDKN